MTVADGGFKEKDGEYMSRKVYLKLGIVLSMLFVSMTLNLHWNTKQELKGATLTTESNEVSSQLVEEIIEEGSTNSTSEEVEVIPVTTAESQVELTTKSTNVPEIVAENELTSRKAQTEKVKTFSELVKAMLDNTVERIVLTADLSQGNQWIDTVYFGGKSFEIDGNGHSITFNSAERTGFNFRKSNAGNLTLKISNITLKKSRGSLARGVAKNMFDFDLRGSNEYKEIIFENVTVPADNKTPLIKANNDSVVRVIGDNEFHNNDTFVFTQRNDPKNPFFNAKNLIFDHTTVKTDVFTDFIYQGKAKSTIEITGSEIEHTTKGGRFIFSYGDKLKLDKSIITSNSEWVAEGYQRESDIYMESDKVKVMLKDSELSLNSIYTAVLQIAGKEASLEVNNSLFNIDFEERNYDRFGTNSAIRFFNEGATYLITNKSEVNFRKKQNLGKAGGSSTIRMVGGGNIFEVIGGSTLKIVNGGGLGEDRPDYNQALEFGDPASSVSNKFIISEPESEVDILSQNGAAVTSVRNLDLELSDQATFIVDGNSARATTGIFNIKGAFNMLIDNPLYFDFVNRQSKGSVIQVGTGSRFVSTQSGLTWWEKGHDVEGSPSYDFTVFDYRLTGRDLQNIEYSEKPEFNTTIYKGQSQIARMSSNNAKPDLSYLRVPTNADKTIYGQAVVSVGPNEYRKAFVNEVRAKMTHNSQIINEKAILSKEKISQWGEASQDGIFSYKLKDFAKAGDVYKITELERGTFNNKGENIGSGQLITNEINQEVTVIDVTPPTPAIVNPLTNTSLILSGSSDEPGATVTATANGQALVDEGKKELSTVVDEEGQWHLALNRALKAGTIVQVFLTDTVGNKNPVLPKFFHDALFKEGTLITVKDDLGNHNKLVKTVKNKSRDRGTYVGDTLVYTIHVSNEKKANEIGNFTKIVLRDELPEALLLDVKTITAIDGAGREIPAANISFEKEQNTLAIKLGKLSPQEVAKVTFETRVTEAGYNTIVKNTAQAIGQSSPQTTDEVSGSVDSPGGKVLIDKVAPKITQDLRNLTSENELNLVGDVLEYRFNISNDAQSPWKEVVLIDKIPELLVVDESSIVVIGEDHEQIETVIENNQLKINFGSAVIDQWRPYKIVFQGRIKEEAINQSFTNQGVVTGKSLDGQILKIDSNEITTVVEAGGIGFVEEPENIDFGVRELTSKKETYMPKEDISLIIRDSRGTKANWELFLKAGQELTSQINPSAKLAGALEFVTEKGERLSINNQDNLIYGQAGTIQTTQTKLLWDRHKKQGLSLNIRPGQAQSGAYQAELVWTLKDTAETVVKTEKVAKK